MSSPLLPSCPSCPSRPPRPPRYVPELVSLCARKIAKECRKMSQKERYAFLCKISKPIKDIINAFPTSYFVWCGNEGLMNIGSIQHFIKYKDDREYIFKDFHKDCKTGIADRKMILRKCSNWYCTNTNYKGMIQTPYDMCWNVCNECKKRQICHNILMMEIKKEKFYDIF